MANISLKDNLPKINVKFKSTTETISLTINQAMTIAEVFLYMLKLL